METGEPGAVTPDTHLTADRAIHSDDHGWTFYDGFLRLLSPDRARGTFHFDRYRTRRFTESPEQLLEEPYVRGVLMEISWKIALECPT